MSFRCVDRYPHLSDLALCQRMAGIVTDLCGEVEGNAQTGLSMFQEIFVSLIRLFRRGKPGVLTHRPETTPIHGGLNPPGERKFSRKTQVSGSNPYREIQRGIEALNLDVGSRFERRAPVRVILRGLCSKSFFPTVQTLLGCF